MTEKQRELNAMHTRRNKKANKQKHNQIVKNYNDDREIADDVWEW